MKQKTRRRSFKNAIAIAIASFASIALISTGLAAFVIIRDASKTAGGNINIGAVTDTNISLTLDNAETGNNIRLDAESGDKTGRVQLDDEANKAVLTFTLSGSVSVGTGKTIEENLDLHFYVNVKDDGSAANTEFVARYVTAKRLDYVGFSAFNTKRTISDETELTIGENPAEATFLLTVGFSWGLKYAEVNPSLFYDSNTLTGHDLPTPLIGNNVEDDDVVAELKLLTLSDKLTFEISVHANNK